MSFNQCPWIWFVSIPSPRFRHFSYILLTGFSRAL